MSSPLLSVRAPLLWLLLPLMGGLVAANTWPVPAVGLWPVLLGAGLAGMAAVALALRGPAWGWRLALVCSMGLAGYALLPARYPQWHASERRPPREVTVVIAVAQTFGGRPASRSLTGIGTILSAGPDAPELPGRRIYFSAIRRISVPVQAYGRYTIRGVIEPLPRDTVAGFSDYLANLGVRQQLTRAQVLREEAPPGRFRRFCTRTQERLSTLLQPGLARHPETLSLYRAMLLGNKAVLDPEQQNAFVQTGTFHIFSISGLHVGVIAVALQGLLRLLRLPARPTVVLTLLVLWLYVQITGGGSPALRAFLMIAFLISSRLLRLPGNAFAALAASALCTLLLDPLQMFSTGFQMSYAVVAALILMGAPLARRWLEPWQPFPFLPKPEWRWWHTFIHWLGRKLISMAAGCWVAFLASIPAGIGFFGVLSPGSLGANLVIIPLSSLAIIAGFLSLLTGLAGVTPWCVLFNSAAAVLIIVMDRLLQHATGLPGVYFVASYRADWLVGPAMALLPAVMLAGASGRWSRRYGGYWPPVIAVLLLVILGVKFG